MATSLWSVIWYIVENCVWHLISDWQIADTADRMKYPLAIINQLLDQYGMDIRLGYNIMCAFIKTLMRSLPGAKAAAFHLHSVVPPFHGHAHNCVCKVYWHPIYIESIGLEDFEECEWTFLNQMNLPQSLILLLLFTIDSRSMNIFIFTTWISMHLQVHYCNIFLNHCH